MLNRSLFRKHFGVALVMKLNFLEHIKGISRKNSNILGLLRKFKQIMPRSSLLTIYKTFIRSWLDYANVIYDKACNSTFLDQLSNNWCNERYFNRKPIPRTRLLNPSVRSKNFTIFIRYLIKNLPRIYLI